ncbi:SDR family oxidoreductase [Streptomyces sp. 8K308]|uniref:type I polyketide synthase n=1 Tax=Streptomyces sp. 8K308 TaxID=2530388 RepID=UPI00104C0EC7|nr:type I polyketide synthase [Streptomyces sp. 8K308]TDC22841.1 SDR family oxidoreductase [Streptomyces sp. 8K308]
MSDTQSRQVPIAVVGIGALLPGSPDAGEFWRTVVAGRDLITDVPARRWLVEDYYDPDTAAPDKTYARRGAFLPEIDFDPMAYGILPNALPATDISQLLALTVAEQVLTDCDALSRVDRGRVGVILGAAGTELQSHMNARIQRPVWLKAMRENGIPEAEAQAVCDRITEHYAPWQESTFPGTLANVIAGRIANRFDLHGTNHTTDAACASSFAALSAAVSELVLGRADLMLSGGVDTANDIGAFLCFSKTPALSASGDCRPFSAAADGTMLGEGLAMYALRRLADAERDGDRVYAVIRGIGTSSDGMGTAIYAPLPEGQARALRRTYTEAGYGPESVELVEGHGTGTGAGDAAEFAALRQVYGESGRTDRQWCALGSVKSQMGHTKCAAGAVGLLKTILALHHKVLPPTIKVDQPNPAMDIGDSAFYLNTQPRPWVRAADHPRRAAVSSFGFGGSNFHVTVEEYAGVAGDRAPWRIRTAPTELVLFSGPSPESLLERQIDGGRPLADIARESQAAFRVEDAVRLAVIAADTADLADKLTRAAAQIRRQPEAAFCAPTGIHYATGAPAVGRIGFLFPGQAAQYVTMGADLAMLAPSAQAVWDRLGSIEFEGRPLHRVVFPPPAFSDEERDGQQALLRATEWAQPALAVHSLALLAVVHGLGLEPDCVAGHSFGELTALHAAGALDAESLVGLARRRGELMREAARTPGAMLAVTAERARVESAIAGSGATDVWLANHNSPNQFVVSGATDTIEIVERELAADGVVVRRLNAATAFHTPIVAGAVEPLFEFLGEAKITEPRIPVYGNADASAYPTQPADIRRRIADHLATPVLFSDEIEAMYTAGVRTFVEVGAGATLTGLVGQILGDREHLAVSLDRKGCNGITALQEAVGRLAVSGVRLDHDNLWAPYAPPTAAARERKPAMTVRLNGGNYGRVYPPEGGATALPAPNPPRQQAVPAPAEQAPAPAAPGAAPVDANWLALIESTQRHTAEAHAACHRMLIDSHMAFLKMTETTFAAMLGGQVSAEAIPTPMVPPPALPAMPVFEAPQSPAAPMTLPTPPPMVAPVASAAPATSAPVVSPAEFGELLLSVVAERTGYPVAMLNLDMALDADLGVDSIKRVEILSAMRERVGDLPEGDVAQLGRLRTLREIVDALTASTAPVQDTVAAQVPTAAQPQESKHQTVLTRLAVRVLDTPAPGLAMAGLGGGLIAVTQDGSGIAELVVAGLTEHGVHAAVVTSVPADARGVVYLGGLAELDSPEQALACQQEAFRVARSVAARFAEQGGLFVTVQDTGGDFGLGGTQPDRVWLGGIAALARTAAKEWPAALVKAIDCERGGRTAGTVASAIVGELLDGGPAREVGLRADGTRSTLKAVPAPRASGLAAKIGPDSVIVATGGARGVTAAAMLDLARTHQPRIVLLGRTELVPEPAGLAAASDEAALTRALAERSGGSGVPAVIAAEARQILAAREVRATVAALEDAGSSVRYLPVDVRDSGALSAALAGVRADWGPVTGIVHGAGVLADKLIADKTDEQFEAVLATKVDGLRALLAATRTDPLDAIILFSSVAAVFGNAGQSDYAVANEVLNQVAAAEAARRPGCLVRALAWGPWDGGMVTPALAEHFGRSGVPLIPAGQGAAACTAELGDPCADTRVVIAAGDDPGPKAVAGEPGVAEVRLSTRTHPYLVDHQVAGIPVLPVALALDLFGRAAAAWRPAADSLVLRDLRVFNKVVLPHLKGSGHRLALRGRPELTATPSALAAELLDADGRPHFRAVLEFGANFPQPTGWDTPDGLVPLAREEIYDGRVLFHGPAFRAIRSVHGVSAQGAEATVNGVDELGWEGDNWQLDPAAVDGGLQLAVLWAEGVLGEAGLPMAVAECRVYRRGAAQAPVRCVVWARKVHDTGARCDLVLLDQGGTPRVELLGVELIRRPD